MRIKRRYAMLGAVAILVLTAGGTAAYAAASGPVSSKGMIDGCYFNAAVNGSHAFVLQDQGTSCPNGTTAVSWSKQGAGASIDRGVITVTEANMGGYTCTESHTSGPDADSITMTAVTFGCQIGGLSATNPFEVTADGFGAGQLGTEPPFGGNAGDLITAYGQASSPSSLLIGYAALGTQSGGGALTPELVYGPGFTFSGTYDWMVILP